MKESENRQSIDFDRPHTLVSAPLNEVGRVLPVDLISINPTDREGVGTHHRTLASAIFAQLRDDILSCRIRPGEKLIVSTISKRFDVSLAAVREALSRLVASGLVVAEDQRGFRASPLSLTDLMDLTNTRIEIECLALRRSIVGGDEAWRQNITLAWQSLQSIPRTLAHDRSRHNQAWATMHGRFHAALVSACGLQWLLKFRATLYEQSERYRQMAVAIKPSGRDIDAEHRAIVEATLAGDVETATAELAKHIERTATAIAEVHQ
jgi:DNA-binding GntR family transcriptional regulator